MFTSPEKIRSDKRCTGFRYEDQWCFVSYSQNLIEKRSVMEKRPGFAVQFGKNRRWVFHPAPWSELYKCDRCGKFGPKWRVRGVFIGDFFDEIGVSTTTYIANYCVSCNNKFKAISNRIYFLNEIAALIRKNKRNLNESTKNTTSIA